MEYRRAPGDLLRSVKGKRLFARWGCGDSTFVEVDHPALRGSLRLMHPFREPASVSSSAGDRQGGRVASDGVLDLSFCGFLVGLEEKMRSPLVVVTD